MSDLSTFYQKFDEVSEESWQEFAFGSLDDVSKLVRNTNEGLRLKPLYSKGDELEQCSLFRSINHVGTKAIGKLHSFSGYEKLKALGCSRFELCLNYRDLSSNEGPEKLSDVTDPVLVSFYQDPKFESLYWESILKRNDNVSYLFDPITFALSENKLIRPLEDQLDEMFSFSNITSAKSFLSVDGHALNSLGIDDVTELVHILYIFSFYLDEAKKYGLSRKRVFSKAHFKVSLSSDVFKNIAKVRALNILLHRLFFECFSEVYNRDSFKVIACGTETERQNIDVHSNILRETTANFSAQVAGCNYFKVSPFTEDSELATRLSLNTFNVIAEEARCSDVLDAAGGSYYLDSLTNDLAKLSWKKLQKLNKQTESVSDYFFKGDFSELVSQQANERNQISIGVNAFENKLDSRLDATPTTKKYWAQLQVAKSDSKNTWLTLKNSLAANAQSDSKAVELTFKPYKHGVEQ